MEAIRIRNPSLELNWLPLSDRKGISLPRMALVDDPNYGGCYYLKTNRRWVIESLDMDLREGAVIILSASKDAGSLAHEYRHHMQRENGLFPYSGSVWQCADGQSYSQAIITYFTRYQHEMDALRYQVKHAPDDVSLQWQDWLIEARQWNPKC